MEHVQDGESEMKQDLTQTFSMASKFWLPRAESVQTFSSRVREFVYFTGFKIHSLHTEIQYFKAKYEYQMAHWLRCYLCI